MLTLHTREPIETEKQYPRKATIYWKDKVYEDFIIADARMAVDLAEGGSRIEFDDGDPTL